MSLDTLGGLRAELQGLAGLDVTDAEANDLLNEGDVEMCVRSEWTKANVNFGPTVAGTNTYAIPSTVYRPLSVAVDGVPYKQSGVVEVRHLRTGALALRTDGVWYLTHASDGVEGIALYPTPGTSGLAITVTSVVYPASSMTSDASVPNTPKGFRRGIVFFAKAIAFGSDEDNEGLEAYNLGKAEEYVSRLRRHRFSRGGRGPTQMRVVGVNA